MPGAHKTIFFDAGGTLFQPFPSVGEIYARASAPFGASCNPAVLESEFYSAWQKRGGLASLGSETSEAKERAWWHSLVKEVFDSHGGVPDFERFFETLYHSFEHKESWEIYPEVLEVLRALREEGWALGIISNWDLRLPRLLRNLELDSYFDFVIGSSACGATKPSEKIFREALKKSNTKPHEAVHVGDSFEEDFLGAEPLGITAFLLDRKDVHHSNTSVPHHARIRTLNELRGRLRR